MPEHVNVNSWVQISGGCPIRYSRNGNDAVDFMFGSARNGYFECGFDVDSLRDFLRVGAEALRYLDSAAESS